MLRRTFLKGLGSAIFAPYVIRTPGLLMPVKERNPLLARYRGKMGFDAGLYYAPYNPILLPVMREIYPEIIARDICSVQPMGPEVGEALQYLIGRPSSFGRLSSTIQATRNALFPTQVHIPVLPGVVDDLAKTEHEPHCNQVSHIQNFAPHNEPYNAPKLEEQCDVEVLSRMQERQKE